MARLPIGRSYGLGAAYQWYSRDTFFAHAPTDHASQSEWRVFLTCSI